MDLKAFIETLTDSKLAAAQLALLAAIALGTWTAASYVHKFEATLAQVQADQKEIISDIRRDRERDLANQKTTDEAQGDLIETHTNILNAQGQALIRMEERLQNFDRLVEMRLAKLEARP